MVSSHFHSIINARSKRLIRRGFDTAPKSFTVMFTVKLTGTNIGAGLRPIRPKVTFRDLSRSIDSWGARERFIAT